jgi:hypothetical protein
MKAFALSLVGFLAVGSTLAHADTVSVAATDVIYAAGNNTAEATFATGTLPVGIAIDPTTGSLTFSVTGTISLDGGISSGGADGTTQRVATSSNTGFGSISGITAPGAGYLVGVFVGPNGPVGAAPAALDFTSTSFSTLSPLIDQTFFIGDGLTGNGTGSIQDFIVPTGATELYLGISDSGGFNGIPDEYADNLGSFSVTSTAVTSASAVPEPSSLLLLGSGALAACGLLRRRFIAS